jgi:hypothetical protein
MTETKQPKSWREQIKVHPAADLFPMMTPDELKALGEDIKENGLMVSVAVTRAGNGPWSLVDGRNRLDAAELVGLVVTFIKKPGDVTVKIGNHTWAVDDYSLSDPYEHVISANVHRRHLTAEQKRDLIAAVLKAQPDKSNRTIAKQTKADHKTVGAVRDALEAGGEIPHHDVHEDARGTRQPARKPPKKKMPSAIGPLDRCPMTVRRIVLDTLSDMDPAQWDQLLTELRGELDDIEKIIRERKQAGGHRAAPPVSSGALP